jgi:NO-binding membrane sensor protein with MHYT domain
MDSLPPLSAFTASIVGLVACAVIYLGAQASGWRRKLAVLAGVAVVVCISVLPYYLLMAFDNLGRETFEPAFSAYLVVSAVSASSALVLLFSLLWSRRRARPN